MRIVGLVLIASSISLVFCQRGTRFEIFGDGGRIVGGEDIRIEEAPYQVSLRQFEMHICGGAIISTTYVITAAHCTFGRLATTLTIQIGSTNNLEGGDIHNITTVKNHPYFNPVTYDYDVSLLNLRTKIKIDNYKKQEITLANYGEYLPLKTPVLVTGFGQTRNPDEPSNILRAVILSVSNQAECHRKYIADGGVTSRMFCAYEVKKDSCLGDSGGPVRRLSDGKLVGLVSFGPGSECALLDWPGAYTRISAIRPWIDINSRN